MTLYRTTLFLICLLTTLPGLAEEKLVLELDLENDLLSLSHHIEGFLFKPTINQRPGTQANINNMQYPAMQNHLAATGLLRLNGEVVGTATEQEIVRHDKERGWLAHSMWMFQINHPGLTGFLAVEQHEDASGVAGMAAAVVNNREKDWPDKWHMFLSTAGDTYVQYASGDLSRFQGARFEEYNGLNQADLANYGRFRGRIRFIIYPVK